MHSSDSAALDLPLPLRSFAATRRILLVVLAASILFPVVFLLGYGYYDYQRRMNESDDVADRVSRVADEQAVKVLDLNREISTRIVEMLADSDDVQIRANQKAIHDRLSVIGESFAQVAAITIFGVNGEMLASNRYFPVPAVSIANRDDFISARAIRPDPYFSLPLVGRVQQTDVFTTSVGRSLNDGRFAGVVSIALKRDYFTGFYRDLSNGEPGMSVGLFRRDGGILVREPPSRAGITHAHDTEFTSAMRNNELFGRVRIRSSIDGLERVVAFRRVGDYPLYVTSGIPTGAIFAQWRQHYTLIAVITAIPCIAVWLLVLFSLRQLRAQQAAWERWQAEVAMRLSAEASSRQLRRMGALGNLVANVAHDFNNLLMVVAANMELARRKNFNGLEREVLAVERATAGAEALARRLLSVARKQPLKQAPIDLSVWLSAATGLIETAAGEKVQVRVQVSSDMWQVRADATELEFAIINIAVNARDAMPQGGRFVIRCQNVRVTADNVLPDGEYALLAFTDSGEGMPETTARRAFEPLFTTKLSGSGTGLGLAQVLAACEQAGGTARLASVPGRGTTVRLYLPRYHGPAAAPVTAAVDAAGIDTPDIPGAADSTGRTAPAGRHPGSILLVEDNEEVAAGVAAVLATFGCDVRHELTADKAFDLLNEGSRFDLVLSDIQMPGRLNGIDLAEKVRGTWPTQRIVLMTGYADEFERARHTGVTILAKPFNIDELRELVLR
ncbi:integral membrane sensor hybrid histidine kinase [Caballeronia udeis]|uniref:histidine kinase n=1 Tax=Caballeronia udeis TaxID=1232866 RepID=A0A158G7Q7_9BURK|nr:hybrid sensor histidine kinase/response regulator [Caballeronia udeis]SAL27669.1 integral membrane sensor hybrid histidine kinase [Caballeronia udeis]